MNRAAAGQADLLDGPRIAIGELEHFCLQILEATGADAASVEAATRAMMHGSKLGIDSHGVRLLSHYVQVLLGGRVNLRPHMRLVRERGSVATLDADNGHGALAAYRAMEHAVQLAAGAGLGAVAICNSSHFGPAGAYAVAATEAGCIGIAMCNSDGFVRLHDGAVRFHGTNPLACAVPIKGSAPWLLDMATSSIPYNRIQLYKSVGRALPEDTASDRDGENTTDPAIAEMLAPLGGAFGFKGAGLAGLIEIFSAVMSGMRLSFDIAPMSGPDFSTPRGLGAFVMAIRTDAFVDEETFTSGMGRYLEVLRASPVRGAGRVLAPGDREWEEAERRVHEGIPVDPDTLETFDELARRFSIEAPRTRKRS